MGILVNAECQPISFKNSRLFSVFIVAPRYKSSSFRHMCFISEYSQKFAEYPDMLKFFLTLCWAELKILPDFSKLQFLRQFGTFNHPNFLWECRNSIFGGYCDLCWWLSYFLQKLPNIFILFFLLDITISNLDAYSSNMLQHNFFCIF